MLAVTQEKNCQDGNQKHEAEDLRTVGLGQTCMAADVPANRAKNRFTNIV